MIRNHIQSELSYETFYPNYENIYRVHPRELKVVGASTGTTVRMMSNALRVAYTNPVDSLRSE